MDYNNVKNRIDRIYSAIKIKEEDGTAEYLRLERIPNSNSAKFAPNINEILNKLLMMVSHISNLKDHLKNIIEKNGGNKQLIEDTINENLALQLIVDLNNAEKHGYPVKNKRSGLDPKIIYVSSALTVVGDGQTSITIHPDGRIEKEGNVTTVIKANILNFQNEIICSFDDLIENSIKAWEKIIADNNIV